MLAGDTPVPRCPGGSPGGGWDPGTPKASLALVLSRPTLTSSAAHPPAGPSAPQRETVKVKTSVAIRTPGYGFRLKPNKAHSLHTGQTNPGKEGGSGTQAGDV